MSCLGGLLVLKRKVAIYRDLPATASRYFQQFQDLTVNEHNRMVHLRNKAAYQMKQLTADKTGFISLSA